MGRGGGLTFGLGEPDEECISVVDDADDPGDKDNENVADDNLGTYWESARHLPFLIQILIIITSSPFLIAIDAASF